MQIPILIEPGYENSVWTQKILAGIRMEATRMKHHIICIECKDYKGMDWDTVLADYERQVIVLAPSTSWAPGLLAYFEEKQIFTILLSFSPAEFVWVRGQVRIDYVQATWQALTYLEQCGRKEIALFGVNQNFSNDQLKIDFFKRWTGGREERVFRTHLSLEESYQRLKPHLLQFNAILCANDIVAVFLLRRLKQDGYTVPEQLYLFSYSYSHLAESVTPGISGVSLDHEETGRQAVRLYSWLLRQKPCTSVSVRVRSRIIVRQSTEMQQPSIGEIVFPQPSGTTEDIYLYHDKEAIRLQDCESIMATCDETDFQLIRGLLEEKSYTRLEEELFLSSYALRYRIKRLLNLTHCESRYELIEFLKYYHSLFS